MISVIIYGRHDDHGYNYKKRIAISINAIASILAHADDEILFVDYNTPDDIPTLPESIAHTLTDPARKKLRTLRVRPQFHRQFAHATHLKIVESIARNIALRRMNPNNRWVLSTNSDLLFVPHEKNMTLSHIVADLEDGFYQLPRYEIPEILWESLFYNPTDAQAHIDFLREYGQRYHLNTATTFNHFLTYDNPGDFQLICRDDLIKIDGFDERMLLGWTVDANICKRLFLLRGEIKNLETHLAAYHCNHTRKESLLHNHKSRYNSHEEFVENITSPYLPQQHNKWGYPDIDFEEISLRGNPLLKFQQAFLQSLPEPQHPKSSHRIILDKKDDSQYDRRYIFPYIVDHLATLHAQTHVAYLGFNRDFADQLRKFQFHMGCTGQFYTPHLDPCDAHSIKSCQVFIIDLLPTPQQLVNSEHKAIKKYVRALLRDLSSQRYCHEIKLIGINVDACNRLLKFKKKTHVVARSTLSNTIYGYVKRKKAG